MTDLDLYLDTLFGDMAGFVYAPTKTSDSKWVQKFFQWPSERELLEAWIVTTSKESDIYIAPSLFREKSALKEHSIGASVVWIEVDGQLDIDLSGLPEPSLRIQSSNPGHEHIYWSVPFSPPAIVESINRRLTYGLEADSSGWDINQVLRPPGTYNFKRDKPVSLIHTRPGIIGTQFFDSFPEPPPLVNLEDYTNLPALEDILGVHNFPPKIWQLFKQANPPKPLRSTFLMHLGYSLAEVGLAHDEIVVMLKEADRTVQKFHGRSDQLIRLAEIASIAIHKYGLVTNNVPSVYTLGELLTIDIEFSSLWGNYWPVGGNVIFTGEPGIGKTQFSLQSAAFLTLGREFVGSPTEQRKCLFCSMEMPLMGFKWLVNHQFTHYTPNEKKYLSENLLLTVPGKSLSLQEIEKLIDEHQPDVIYFDSVASLSEDDMSSEKEARRITKWDETIRASTGISTWYIHHNRKAQIGNTKPLKLSDVYGSYLWQKAFDSVLILGQHGSTINVYPVKTRYGKEEFYPVERDDKSLTFKKIESKAKGVALDSIQTGTLNLPSGMSQFGENDSSGHGNESNQDDSGT